VSRIALGLAAIHFMDFGRRRQLVEGALDLGITHFDTSRFYGDGLSERSLGKILGAERRSVTLTTKFGLLPTPLFASLGIAAPLARKGRSALKHLRVMDYPKRSYSPETMRKSLRDSLQALATDYIDIYSLHEPLPDFAAADDLFDDLLQEKRKGTIRFIGVSGYQIDAVVKRYGGVLDVIQCSESEWSPERFVPDITHSLFSDNVAQSGSSRTVPIRLLLESALARREAGAVIVQTGRPEHLRQIVSWGAQK
jgi:aryl-alcohol dehydrogenase-like predicted oxidoreductase